MEKEMLTITITARDEFVNLIKRAVRDEINHSNSISVEKAKFVSIKTVSKKMGLSRTAIYDRIRQGKITLYKEGRRSLFNIEEIENLVNPSSNIIK